MINCYSIQRTIETILQSGILLNEDFDIVELSLNKLRNDRSQINRNTIDSKSVFLSILIIILAIVIKITIIYWIMVVIAIVFINVIVKPWIRLNCYRQQRLTKSLINEFKNYFNSYKALVKLYHDFKSILHNDNEHVYLSNLLKDTEQSIRSSQITVIQHIFRDIELLNDFAHITDDYEKLFIQNFQLIFKNDLSVPVSFLCILFCLQKCQLALINRKTLSIFQFQNFVTEKCTVDQIITLIPKSFATL